MRTDGHKSWTGGLGYAADFADFVAPSLISAPNFEANRSARSEGLVLAKCGKNGGLIAIESGLRCAKGNLSRAISVTVHLRSDRFVCSGVSDARVASEFHKCWERDNV